MVNKMYSIAVLISGIQETKTDKGRTLNWLTYVAVHRSTPLWGELFAVNIKFSIF